MERSYSRELGSAECFVCEKKNTMYGQTLRLHMTQACVLSSDSPGKVTSDPVDSPSRAWLPLTREARAVQTQVRRGEKGGK